MIRRVLFEAPRGIALVAALGIAAGAFGLPCAFAQTARKKQVIAQAEQKKVAKRATARSAGGKAEKAAARSGAAAKPTLVASFGDWGAYAAAAGKNKTCYALAQPKDRQPSKLRRDPGYLFISTRPAEGVHNEVSIVMGFDVQPDSSPTAEIGTESFPLVAKGANLWLENAAKEPQFVNALRKGQKLIVKASSKKGHLTTDTYSLTGITQAIDRVQKDCR
jgi:hypothetical protein